MHTGTHARTHARRGGGRTGQRGGEKERLEVQNGKIVRLGMGYAGGYLPSQLPDHHTKKD